MLRSVLELRPLGARPTGSDVETIALQAFRRGGLRPMRQWRVDEEDGTLIGYVDFVFPPRALGVEIDGLETHDLDHRQHDYDRQRRIENRGFLIRRFTREDARSRPKYMRAAVRQGLQLAPYL
jgi:very-short-patch-repair endonuclease